MAGNSSMDADPEERNCTIMPEKKSDAGKSESVEEKELIPGSNEIAIIDEHTIRDKIYVVRGVQVMLDFELAEIYGYTTSAFNQQVKNNIAKFDDDFRFQLTRDEVDELSRSKKLILNKGKGRGSNIKYLPWAFTESGLYMLMTVLKGELATQQSKALIRIFRAMKDQIIQGQGIVTQRDFLRLSIQTMENTEALRNVQSMLSDQKSLLENQQRQLLDEDDKIAGLIERMNDTVRKSDLSPVLLQFNSPDEPQEYLLLNGQPAKADETYMNIYAQAKHTVYIVDNYINIKTLRQLQSTKAGVSTIVFSDNLQNNLHLSDHQDFQIEFPSVPVVFQKTGGIIHDRFIVLDYNTPEERMFHCGASAKDAAVKLTTAIMEITSADMKAQMHGLFDQLLKNPALVLK